METHGAAKGSSEVVKPKSTIGRTQRGQSLKRNAEADSQQQNGTNGGNVPDHSTFPIHAGESEKFGPVLPKHAPSLTRFIGKYVHMYTYIRAHICVHIMYMCLLR